MVTDAAIVQATLARQPRRVLDLGCGEGWFCRALAEHGIETVGIDASEPLIEAARAADAGTYAVLPFAELGSAAPSLGRFEMIVCNFALLEPHLAPLLRALRTLLQPGGVLLIQTLHPPMACGEAPYRDGWRTETFAGIGAGFPEPMPWYFRTVESWLESLAEAGWRVLERREPVHPDTGLPASLLLLASPTA